MGTPNIGGDLTGSIDEGDLSITGDLDDIGAGTGNTDDTFTITVQATYGTATINSSTGTWTYTLDNTDPDVIALSPGDTLTDIFTVNMLDNAGFGAGGSDTDNVTITINGIICYAAGTLIETPDGPRAIEDICAGDLVLNAAGDARPVLWMGGRVVTEDELDQNPKMRPIRITAGALGDGLPRRDLVVSRQHRMVIRSPIAERMFGVPEVFVPAIRLIELPGIFVDDTVRPVTYLQLLFDRHEVILAEGAPSESLFTGPEALKVLTSVAQAEIFEILDRTRICHDEPRPARPIPKGRLQRKLVTRHATNRTPLLNCAQVRVHNSQ